MWIVLLLLNIIAESLLHTWSKQFPSFNFQHFLTCDFTSHPPPISSHKTFSSSTYKLTTWVTIMSGCHFCPNQIWPISKYQYNFSYIHRSPILLIWTDILGKLGSYKSFICVNLVSDIFSSLYSTMSWYTNEWVSNSPKLPLQNLQHSSNHIQSNALFNSHFY